MAENQQSWEDYPYSSAPLLWAPFQLVQQEIWGLCLLFLALTEVVSVAEDTGAVARGPAGAGTVIPGSKISSAPSDGEQSDLGKYSHADSPCSPDSCPYCSDPKQSGG